MDKRGLGVIGSKPYIIGDIAGTIDTNLLESLTGAAGLGLRVRIFITTNIS